MTFPLSYVEECAEKAQELSNKYGFFHSDEILPRLHLSGTQLQLLSQQFKPIFVDFTDISIQKRVEKTKNQGLIKAIKPHKGLKIIDATAGFGTDAYVLASLGAEVLMLERCKMLVALLQDGLLRLKNEGIWSGKLALIETDSFEYISNIDYPDFPDVIYLDPMHPTRKKTALVKKEMQVLQEILGFDADINRLLNAAIVRCKQFVVVKWPQKEIPILKPHHSILGKTVRFDVYYPG
jgi:16S rRNA (guanine1516-N2)-methyltransferase